MYNFSAAATNHVNTKLKCIDEVAKNTNFCFKVNITFSLSLLRNFLHWYLIKRLFASIFIYRLTLLNLKEIRCVKSIIMLCV